MGLCQSAEENAERQRTAQIDSMIRQDAKEQQKDVKMLLLGSGESGKSTIVKQMKIIHKDGYSPEELLFYRGTVATNIVMSLVDLAVVYEKFNIKSQDEKVTAHVSFLQTHPTEATDVQLLNEPPYVIASYQGRKDEANRGLSPQWGEIVDSIWNDPATKKLLDERSSEFYLMDNTPYFFSEIKRIAAPGYVPSQEDVLRTRIKTTGISETRFSMGELRIRMFDVGGQRSERKKWIHCFEEVTCVIYCVAMSEYDQGLLEENSQNRMAESLTLFDSIVNSRWFIRTSFLLFLNKVDLFKIKMKKVPLVKYFPDYDGDSDPNTGAKYLLKRFLAANRAKRSIYPHLTQATDTANMRAVFAAVRETLIRNGLKNSGVM